MPSSIFIVVEISESTSKQTATGWQKYTQTLKQMHFFFMEECIWSDVLMMSFYEYWIIWLPWCLEAFCWSRWHSPLYQMIVLVWSTASQRRTNVIYHKISHVSMFFFISYTIFSFYSYWFCSIGENHIIHWQSTIGQNCPPVVLMAKQSELLMQKEKLQFYGCRYN